ncbi:MAG: adenylate/guanylate cyclase domain-containing protein [Stellaceae bacterium]
MTAIDLLIMAVTIYAIWRCLLIGPSKRPSASQVGLRLIALGLLVVCLFYFADLVSMYVLPAVTSTEEAMEFMGALHRNLSWLVVLFSMIVISGGYVELGRTQVELMEKNELLTDLSSKLAKFLPSQLYNSIFTGTHTASVAAQRKKLTIFFSDIANFTGTTDSLESEELTNLLNQYLTEMSKIAVSYGATIDKYVGDAIVGFFGDPASRGSQEDAIACVKMAIAMQRRMHDLQLTWVDLGSEKPFQMRIGVNTGFCTVGNFGSEDRMDYTIIGNEVNLAARLQSHAELGGILVTHETCSLIKDTILTEEQEAVFAKGFAHPVRAYRVVGIYDELEKDGRIIREERDGFRLLVDLTKSDQAGTIAAVENVLAQLRG